jgi:hypothetical protein
MPNQPKQSRGGKRPFSGRKKADYQTTTISFRVRVEWADEIKQMVKDKVAENKKNKS